MFQYERVYWLESPWESDSMVLTGAALDPEWGWTFWRGGEERELDGATTRSFRLTELQGSRDGYVSGSMDGVTFVFRPVAPEQVRAEPSRFGLTPEVGALVKTQADVYLYLHAMRVPDWYEERYTAVVSEAVENNYQLLNEGREAPEGAIHYWASKGKYYRKTNGEWRELPASFEWKDSDPSLPRSSYDTYIDPVTGQLTPERAAKHKEIIDRLFVGKEPTTRPLAVLTMGLPASGKSTLSRTQVEAGGSGGLDNLVVLDPDMHREHLDEYQAAVKLKVRNGASIVHKEVTALNDAALDRAMADDPEKPGQHYNFLLDGVGSDVRWYRSLIETLKAKGYRIQLLFAHVGDTPELSGIDRLKIRVENRGLEKGRFVESARITSVYEKLPANFNELAMLVDDAAVFDTSVSGRPVELYSRRGGAVSGDPNWYARRPEESRNRVTTQTEGKVAGKNLTFDAVRASYLRALKADLADADTRPTGDAVKYEVGNGIIDPLLDPVMRPEDLTSTKPQATLPAEVTEAKPGTVRLVNGSFYEYRGDGYWAKIDWFC